jgi:hypothetical protein
MRMLMKQSVVLAVASIGGGWFGAYGGDQAADVAPAPAESHILKVKSTAELRSRIALGMPTNRIVAEFGRPILVNGAGESMEFWIYALTPFPADDQMRGTWISSFSMEITNGHLAFWSTDHETVDTSVVRSISTLVSNEDVAQKPTTARSTANLEFYLVSTNRLPNGRFIDTEFFPKLGYIAAVPDLTITKVKKVSMVERQKGDESGRPVMFWRFGIDTAEQAPKLADLTSSNLLSKMLVMIGNEPIMAARIDEPIETGNFSVDCTDRAEAERVKKALAKLQRSQ